MRDDASSKAPGTISTIENVEGAVCATIGVSRKSRILWELAMGCRV